MTTSNDNLWESRRGRIETHIGKWVGGHDVFIHKYSIFNDMFMKMSYMQIMALNVTGRMISPALSTWLENNFMTMSYPDSRIWCNQMGAFVGQAHGSPVAAVAAGCLAADSKAYGGSKTSQLAMQYIMQARSFIDAGGTLQALIEKAPLKNGKPSIIGFMRPVAKNDERIEPHRRLTKELGFEIGPHLSLAEDISEYLRVRYGAGMGVNIGGFTAAFMADQGFSPDELYQLKAMCVASGVVACYIDALRSPENGFLPLRCSDISYEGTDARPFISGRSEVLK